MQPTFRRSLIESVIIQGVIGLIAAAVKNALTGQGVNPARMSTIGYGESKPIADNNTESGRQMNRRVEITIAPQG